MYDQPREGVDADSVVIRRHASGSHRLSDAQGRAVFGWVAEFEGRRIGAAVLVEEPGGIARIRRLRVEPDWRGRRIACRLLSHAAADAIEHGCLKLLVETRPASAARMKRLLTCLGYRPPEDSPAGRPGPAAYYVDLYRRPAETGRCLRDLDKTPTQETSIMQDRIQINDAVTVGAQPSAEQLEELQQNGFRSVVNLRTDGEEEQPLSPDDEGKKVAALGMTYYHEPVDSSAMGEAQVDRFRERFADLPTPVYAHCKSGKRAGAFVVMDMAVRQGMSGEQTLKQAEEMGFECEEPELKQFVSGYVDSRVEKERR